jgi:pimeloyl-ACP methyl ester carboxylesterase
MRHAPDGPLITSRRGFFWVGSERVERPFGTVARGPMFVAWEAPAEVRQPHPVVLIHGGGGQGTDWLGTPDGRPGWATYLVQEGFVVYVVDRPGHGRSALHPEVLGPMSPPLSYEVCEWLFTPRPEGPASHPTSHLHTQWPGSGGRDDPAVDQFMASQGPMVADTAAAHALERARGEELLDRIGPAILVSHSAGGPLGWLMADVRPELVRALVAVEPLGPPFLENGAGGLSLPWGLTAAPLTFDPPAGDATEVKRVVRDQPAPGAPPIVMQADPPRRLVNLARVPIALVSGEASPFADIDGYTDGFLTQAGCDVDRLRLADHGVHGNAHGMMLERNNREVLDVILRWLARRDVANEEPNVRVPMTR